MYFQHLFINPSKIFSEIFDSIQLIFVASGLNHCCQQTILWRTYIWIRIPKLLDLNAGFLLRASVHLHMFLFRSDMSIYNNKLEQKMLFKWCRQTPKWMLLFQYLLLIMIISAGIVTFRVVSTIHQEQRGIQKYSHSSRAARNPKVFNCFQKKKGKKFL